jgi:2-methylcitrate dehydratase PrpD
MSNFLLGGATQQLAEFASVTSFDDLPRHVVADCKILILDTLACAVGATHMPAAKLVTRYASESPGTETTSATLIGAEQRVTPAAAAYANCHLGFSLDADETLINSAHLGVCAVFPALASCEATDRSGRDFITAVAVGYEVGARIALSFPAFVELETGEIAVARTGGLGFNVFTAVVASARALRLSPEDIASAIGIAGWSAPISAMAKWWETQKNRPETKYAPYASMGWIGVTSAELASAGLRGDQSFLDGENGYWSLVGAQDCQWETLSENLGAEWKLSLASYKPYCSARLFHGSIDGFCALLTKNALGPDDIASVRIETYAVAASDQYVVDYPETPLDGQFSLPFNLALAAYGRIDKPGWIFDGSVFDPRLKEFASRVAVVSSPELTSMVLDDLRQHGRSRLQPARVEIQTKRGSSHVAYVEFARGDPWSSETRFSAEDIKRKFQMFVRHAMPSDDMERVLTLVSELETVSDLKALTGFLGKQMQE